MEKYKYVTIGNEFYLKGILALNYTIQQHSKYSLLVLAYDITENLIKTLKEYNIEFKIVDKISSPKESKKYSGTYTKLHVFNLTEYDKIIFLDSDTIILKPIDDLFELPIKFGATTLKGVQFVNDQFSPGLMVIKPDNKRFRELMHLKDEIHSYDGGDQGFLNEVYKDIWHRIPDEYHVTKRIYRHHPQFWDEVKDKIKVLHYPGKKPWQEKHIESTNFEYGYEELESIWWNIYNKLDVE